MTMTPMLLRWAYCKLRLPQQNAGKSNSGCQTRKFVTAHEISIFHVTFMLRGRLVNCRASRPAVGGGRSALRHMLVRYTLRYTSRGDRRIRVHLRSTNLKYKTVALPQNTGPHVYLSSLQLGVYTATRPCTLPIMTTYIPSLTLPASLFQHPAAAILLPVAAGTAVGFSTRPKENQNTYLALRQPPLRPPPQVFGPMWTLLYGLMGYAAYRAWNTGMGGFDAKKAQLALVRSSRRLHTVGKGIDRGV